MWETAEIRWFYEGDVPSEVENWQPNILGRPDHQPIRTDYYLRLAKGDALGIKLREGRIEIKQRVVFHGIVQLHQNAVGRLQTWRKWSLPLARTAMQWRAPEPASSWIAVRKDRRLHRYAHVEESGPVAAPTHHYPPRGCDLELTRLTIGRRQWWSLALEGFGPRESLCRTVEEVGQLLFQASRPRCLEEERSWSYPEWLAIADVG